MLLELINDILDLSKVETGRVKVELGPVSLNDVMRECIILTESAARKSGIRIDNTLANGQLHYIHADPMRFKQVIINLLSNAIKYNRQAGSVTISARAGEGGGVRVIVDDTGIGMAQDKLSLLFEPFNRLGAEHSAVEGHGIGLALVKRLVGLMQGRIGVESVAGEGSRFWVEFPGAEPGQAAATPQTSNDPLVLESRMQALRDKKLLYIEDNAVNRLLMSKILAPYTGIEFRCAETGAEGVAAVAEFQPDLVLLDMQLPDFDGDEVITRLRQQGLAVPVIACSANATEEAACEMLDMGAAAYLTKPVDVKKLKQALLEVLAP